MEIAQRGDKLDLAWLKDESGGSGELGEPEEIAAEILDLLQGAVAEIESLQKVLDASSDESQIAGGRQ
jgi:type I restriction enzyme M protein